MTTIREEDLIASISDALQFISHDHPADYVANLADAWRREESPAARDAIGQILANSRMAAYGRRPICQDIGTAQVFMRMGLIHEFVVEDMPVTVAVDATGDAVHRTGPARWRRPVPSPA